MSSLADPLPLGRALDEAPVTKLHVRFWLRGAGHPGLSLARLQWSVMPDASDELRAITETALRALNSADLETFLTVVADDVEFTSMIAEVEGQTFRGHDGVRSWWSSVSGAFQEVRWELLELEGSSPRGLAKLRAVADVDGVEVEQMVWQAASFRDGRLDWWAFFRDENAARAAAGLLEYGRRRLARAAHRARPRAERERSGR